jgi:ankyrin repeat protein
MWRLWLLLAVPVWSDERQYLHELAASRTPPAGQALLDAIKSKSSHLNSVNENGQTPLHIAASEGTSEMVEMLIKAGAKVTARDAIGREPLHYISMLNMEVAQAAGLNMETIERQLRAKALILRDAGGNLNGKDKDGMAPLHLAVQHGSVVALEALAASDANVEETCHHGTALHLAAMLGNPRAIHALKKWGANLDAKHDLGYTPLYMAVMTEHVDAISALVAVGSSLQQVNQEGLSPLQFAVTLGKVSSMSALVAYGADAHAASSQFRWSPFEMAGTNMTLLRALA